jgi:hypothetical protein
MRIRHILSEAVTQNEISKVEGLIALECVKAEVIQQVLVKAKLPAESSVDRAENTVRDC